MGGFSELQRRTMAPAFVMDASRFKCVVTMVEQIFAKPITLSRQLGIPKSAAYRWRRGRRPLWRLMPQIANALNAPLPRVVEGLWTECVGDPCPCGVAEGRFCPRTSRKRERSP